MNGRCLLITGTVVPNALVMGPNDNDIEIRRKQYLSSLSFYSETLDDPIYFLENSAYDFSDDEDFQQLFDEKRITLIKHALSDQVERGKGYQEFEMIDQAVVNLATQYRSFVKITGRYQYQNIRELVECDCRGLVMDMQRRHNMAFTSIFSTTFAFYQEYISGLYVDADDSQGEWIENILYRSLKKRLKNKEFRKSMELFPISPEPEINTKIKRLKFRIRCVERIILRRFSAHEFYLAR